MVKVLNARLLHISEVIGIVDVTLRIKIAITDFDGMIKMELGHGGDYINMC